MKVYIHNGNQSYLSMFLDRGWVVVSDPANADYIQFTGGSDVSPELYGQKNHPTTYNDIERDKEEVVLFNCALRNDIKMLGICRGGQFLNVMCGGSMIQHCDGHATGLTHPLFDRKSSTHIQVTSTHHQMMVKGDTAEIVASVSPSLSTFKYMMHGDEALEVGCGVDIEVLYYKFYKSLCFQPHPEFSRGECQDYYFELIDRYE